MAFHPGNKIISASHALTILWLVTNIGTNQPSKSQTQVYYDLHLAKPAFVLLAQLFDVSPTTTYSWLRPASEAVIEETIKEIEIGEGRNFSVVKKAGDGSSKPWTVIQGKSMVWVLASLNGATRRNCTINYHRWKSVQMTGRVAARFSQKSSTWEGKSTQFSWNKIAPISDTILEEWPAATK